MTTKLNVQQMGNTHSAAGIGVGGWLVAIVAAPFTGGSSLAVTAAVAGTATFVGGAVGFTANAVQNRDGTVDDFTSGVGKGIVIPMSVAAGKELLSDEKQKKPAPAPPTTTTAVKPVESRSTITPVKPSAIPTTTVVKPTASSSLTLATTSTSSSTTSSAVKHKTYAVYDPAKNKTTIASTRTVETCKPVNPDNGLQRCSVQRDTTYTTTDGKLIKTRSESGTEFRNTRTGTSQSVATGTSLDLTSTDPRTASQVHVAATVNRKYALDAVPATVKAVKAESSYVNGHVQVSTTSTGYSTRSEVSISTSTAEAVGAVVAAAIAARLGSGSSRSVSVPVPRVAH